MQACPNRTIPVRCALIFLASCAVHLSPEDALAVRPFVTDDARIVYRGQVVTETYGGITMVKGDKPAFEARTLEGLGLTDRFELTAGGFGVTYQDNHSASARPADSAEVCLAQFPGRDSLSFRCSCLVVSPQRQSPALGWLRHGSCQLVSVYTGCRDRPL